MSRGYLLDTHALLFWLDDSSELSTSAQRTITDVAHRIAVSAASLWEIAIKARRKRLSGVEPYLADFEYYHQSWGFDTLPIAASHGVRAGLLVWDHTDPFDRMLVAQSQITGMPLVTRDKTIHTFHPSCVW
ncbi:MAG: type II toxin-antitoxin system VapC family toxin [Myxococcota bacterium]